ncbi:hypothetical protein [Alteromonas flava]|uniref:hypothetical protein n=1 Tax=Alteromonas flava TaxID=2048003 RepID=UPI000C288B2B|nr:hypothetical protein [Alteromonas flava]
MQHPFTVEVAENMVQVRFLESFHHTKHYRGLINAVMDIVATSLPNKQWALLVDWGNLFIQIPEEEKLCMLFLQEYKTAGLRYLVNITPKHPVVDWQMNKIIAKHSDIDIMVSDDVTEGLRWLAKRNIDVQANAVEITPNWFKPSDAFSALLKKYNLSASKFDARYE